MPVASVDAAIQGRVARVCVNSGTGKPGQAINVRVRGNSSISAGSQPLYVVAGMPVTTADRSNNGGATNPLSTSTLTILSPSKSLKALLPGCIYGSRAANSGVLITAKPGKAGKTSVSLNYQRGSSGVTRRVKFLNADEYGKFYSMAANNRDRTDGSDTQDPDSFSQYMLGAGGFPEYYSLCTYPSAAKLLLAGPGVSERLDAVV